MLVLIVRVHGDEKPGRRRLLLEPFRVFHVLQAGVEPGGLDGLKEPGFPALDGVVRRGRIVNRGILLAPHPSLGEETGGPSLGARQSRVPRGQLGERGARDNRRRRDGQVPQTLTHSRHDHPPHAAPRLVLGLLLPLPRRVLFLSLAAAHGGVETLPQAPARRRRPEPDRVLLRGGLRRGFLDNLVSLRLDRLLHLFQRHDDILRLIERLFHILLDVFGATVHLPQVSVQHRHRRRLPVSVRVVQRHSHRAPSVGSHLRDGRGVEIEERRDYLGRRVLAQRHVQGQLVASVEHGGARRVGLEDADDQLVPRAVRQRRVQRGLVVVFGGVVIFPVLGFVRCG